MMDLGVLFLQILGILIWTSVMVPALILVSKIDLFLFYFIFSNQMADNADPTQFDPRAQAMKEVHFDWRCIVCCMVALSPLQLEQQHLPGTESVYFDIDNTPWVKCDKCHTSFHLHCGTWESVYVVRSDIFFVPSFVVGSFTHPCPSPCHLILIDLFSCHLKMACKARCPDTLKGTKKPGD